MEKKFNEDLTQMRLIVSMSLRSIARALSVLLLIYLFLSFVVNFTAFLQGPETRAGDLDIGMIIMAVGLLASWFRGGIGGIVVLIGYFLEMIGSHHLVMNWVFALIPLTGLMFLVAVILDKGKPNRFRL